LPEDGNVVAEALEKMFRRQRILAGVTGILRAGLLSHRQNLLFKLACEDVG